MNKKSVIYIIVGFGLALMVLAYIVANNIAKKSPPPPAKLPDDNNPAGTGEPITPSEQQLLDNLATQIYNDIKGVRWSLALNAIGWGLGSAAAYNDSIYNNANNLSNRLLAALYNTYNARYFKEYDQTLTQAIESETESDSMYQFRVRLQNLGLK